MAEDNREPQAIEADIEAARERLADNLDTLLYRAKPSTIAQRETSRAKAYFVDPDTGQARQDNIVKVVGAVAGVILLAAVLRRLTRES